MNGSLFGKVYIQFSAQQNYGIPYFFPMVPSPSPPKKETQKQVPQTFDHRKLPRESREGSFEPQHPGNQLRTTVPHVQVRKDNSRNSHDEASGNWMVWNKWYGWYGCQVGAIPKTGLFKQVLGFRSLVVLLFRIQGTVFQWLGFLTQHYQTITCLRWCPMMNKNTLKQQTLKRYFFGDREELHPNILYTGGYCSTIITNLGCKTNPTNSGKWRFRYRDPLPAKKDVDKIILVVGQHPGEPKNKLATGIWRVKRGYYCWWKKIRRSPVEVGSWSHYLEDFIHLRWLFGIVPSTVSPLLTSLECDLHHLNHWGLLVYHVYPRKLQPLPQQQNDPWPSQSWSPAEHATVI